MNRYYFEKPCEDMPPEGCDPYGDMKILIWWLAIVAAILTVPFYVGCACTPCQAQEPRASEQSAATSKGWRPARVPLPVMAVPQAQLPTPPPRDEFATPPDDQPPVPAPTEPTAPPESPPTPTPTPTPRKAKVTMTYETDGGNIIAGNSAPIYFHSPPGTQTPASQAITPASYPVPIYAIPAAEPQRAPATRLGGALYYLARGQCPPRPTQAAAYALLPQQAVAAVPLRMAAVPAPAYYLPVASPYPVPADVQIPMTPYLASPQDAGRKCRLFGR